MKYLIELVAEQTGFEPTTKALQDLGKVDKANAEQFKKTNEEAKKYTSTLDGVSKGIKEVTKASAGGIGAKALEDSVTATQSFRTQLRLSREEITKLFVAGQASASQIYNMARGGGELKDAIGDASQAINVLSSDTFKLDATLQGLQVGTSIFQGLAGASALFGEENEEVQKTLLKINAIMAITQSLQQIQNALQAQSAFRLGASVVAQKAYNIVVGESVGVTKAFRIALASLTGGILIAGLIAIVANWKEIKEAITGSSKSLEDFKKFQSEVAESTGNELANLMLLKKTLDDENVSRKQKNELIKKAKEDYPEYLGQLTDEQFYTTALNDAIAKQTQLIKARALAKVIEKEIEDEIIKKRKLETNGISFASGVLSFLRNGFDAIAVETGKQLSESDKRIDELTASYLKAVEEINKLGQTVDPLDVEKKVDPLDVEKKKVKDKEDLAKKALDARRKELEDEIAILETNKIELRNNRKEVLKIDEDLIIARAKLAKLGEKSLAKIGLIDSQTIQAISDLHDKYYAEEKARIEKNTKSFQDAEKIKRDEISETNKFKLDALERERKANKENAEKIAKLLADENKAKQEQYDAEIKERIAKVAKAFQDIQTITNAIFDFENDRIQQNLQARLSALNTAKEKELSNKELTEAQKDRINKRYASEELKLKKQAFEQEKKTKLAQAFINSAVAVTTLATQTPPPSPAFYIGTALIALTTALQVATIQRQKFAKGTEFVKGKGTSTSDEVPAMLSVGERVIDAQTNSKLKGIPNKMLPALIAMSAPKVNSSILSSIEKNISFGMDYDKMAKSIGKEMRKNNGLNLNIDKSGFKMYLQQGDNYTQILNNTYNA